MCCCEDVPACRRRSSATNVFELLRLAPNLLVTQLSASSYIVAARGLGGNPVAQNFSNKVLMLVDGRSVYSPLFSGIYSDALDMMLQDIEKIEVISGPGATLSGANAMNGVINIITHPVYLTTGSFVDLGVGNNVQTAGARDGWAKAQGWFRYDWGQIPRHPARARHPGCSRYGR
ncbi:MAG: TonB-dependent receptor plug domain-containing protein [Gammaproteobacteria bacterium]